MAGMAILRQGQAFVIGTLSLSGFCFANPAARAGFAAHEALDDFADRADSANRGKVDEGTACTGRIRQIYFQE